MGSKIAGVVFHVDELIEHTLEPCSDAPLS